MYGSAKVVVNFILVGYKTALILSLVAVFSVVRYHLIRTTISSSQKKGVGRIKRVLLSDATTKKVATSKISAYRIATYKLFFTPNQQQGDSAIYQ